MCKAGFSSNFATRVKQPGSILERLCEALKCTPNDPMKWRPDKDLQISDSHPLQELRRTEKLFDLTKSLSALPLSKLNKIEELLDELS